jgi:enoyl-CoA hydratase
MLAPRGTMADGVGNENILYEVRDRVAYITLNRPDRLNAIDAALPGALRSAVERAGGDQAVHVIVLAGAGRSFSAGYDLKDFAEGNRGAATQDMPWDPMRDYRAMKAFTDDFMSLWRSPKPTIAKVHGHAVAGGSDLALSCDLVVMAEDARIGYPPARVWGCPTTAMWVYRLGAEKAKRMLFTGDLVDGRTAQAMGLILEAVPADRLDAAVDALARRISAVPKNQLLMQKLVINQALEQMGLATSQILAAVFDGIARHSPEGLWFKQLAEREGFHEAVRRRDGGEPLPDGEEARRLLRQG